MVRVRQHRLSYAAGLLAGRIVRPASLLQKIRAVSRPVTVWLGRKNIETTYRIYGHLVPKSWEWARLALDATVRKRRPRVPYPRHEPVLRERGRTCHLAARGAVNTRITRLLVPG